MRPPQAQPRQVVRLVAVVTDEAGRPPVAEQGTLRAVIQVRALLSDGTSVMVRRGEAPTSVLGHGTIEFASSSSTGVQHRRGSGRWTADEISDHVRATIRGAGASARDRAAGWQSLIDALAADGIEVTAADLATLRLEVQIGLD